MRLAAMLIALTGALSSTGCSQLVSLNPAVTEADASMDPALAGVWRCDDDVTVTIKEAGNAYDVTYAEKTDDETAVARFEGRLMQVPGGEIIDIVPKDTKPLQVPVHMFLRIWLEGTTMRIAILDSEWLRDQAARQLSTQASDYRMLITSPTEQLRNFLLQYGADEGACDDPEVLQKEQ